MLQSKKTFKCRGCKKTFDRIFLKKGTFTVSTGTGKCAPCVIKYERARYIRIRVRKYPDKYKTCKSCDHIFYKYPIGGNYNGFKNCDELGACPKCKSGNIAPIQ